MAADLIQIPRLESAAYCWSAFFKVDHAENPKSIPKQVRWPLTEWACWRLHHTAHQFSILSHTGPGCVAAANERTLPELIEHFSDKPTRTKPLVRRTLRVGTHKQLPSSGWMAVR